MTINLITMRLRLSQQLTDENRAIWAEDVLDEAIRLALGRMGTALGQPLYLDGLDGAVETTLMAEDEHVLLLGALAYAIYQRAATRHEDDAPVPQIPQLLQDLAKHVLQRFEKDCDKLRVRALQMSFAVPYAAWQEGG